MATSKEDIKTHEKWIRKIAREESLKVLKAYKDELSSHPAFNAPMP